MASIKRYMFSGACCALLCALAACDDTSGNAPSSGTAIGSISRTPAAHAVVTLSADSYTASADSGVITIVGTRTSDVSVASSVQYATRSGTALAGDNFVATSGTLRWAAGDSTPKSISVRIASAGSGGKAFTVALTNPTGAVLGTPSDATVTLAASATSRTTAGMMLISRGVKAHASSGTASLANDSDYNTTWRSSGVPATLSYDLSSVAPSNRKSILLAWYNDASYSYDHALLDAPAYNNVGSYTIEANRAPGGGEPPVSGWVTLTTVSANTLHSKQHVLQFANYNWIRLNATASDGSSGNSDVSVKMDIYDASHGVTDGWFFGGDSITANCTAHRNSGSVASDSFGNQVHALVGVIPIQENAGMPGWTTVNWIGALPMWLQSFPGKYVTLNLGSNDAAGNPDPSVFYGHMATLIDNVVAAGKIPVVPTIPWSRDPTHAASIPRLNAQIHNLYHAFPSVIPGPDLYALFKNNQQLISADNLHPTDEGCAALRAGWATVAAKSAYGSK